MSETLANLFRRKTDPTPDTPNASLFEQLGGEAAVGTAVDLFYRKVMADARINYFFFGVNITEQAAKQKAFLSMAFGGPHEYTGRDMRRSHAKLVGMGLNDRHFDIVLDHLRDTLLELQAPEPLIQQVIAICECTRDDVLSRKPRETDGHAPILPVPAAGSSATVSERQPAPASPAPSDVVDGTVASILSKGRTLSASSPIREAAELLSREGAMALPVVDEEGKLLGMVTAADLLRHYARR
jgi:hemoglobin